MDLILIGFVVYVIGILFYGYKIMMYYRYADKSKRGTDQYKSVIDSRYLDKTIKILVSILILGALIMVCGMCVPC